MKWSRGADIVDAALAAGRLERISGSAADGSALFASARALLASARRELAQNAEASYVLAYDAARKSATALLAHQGLRTKSAGHHVTVEHIVRAHRRRL